METVVQISGLIKDLYATFKYESCVEIRLWHTHIHLPVYVYLHVL